MIENGANSKSGAIQNSSARALRAGTPHQRMSDASHLHASKPRNIALWVAATYFIVATAWILSSDLIVDAVFSEGAAPQIHSTKGIFFIIVTALCLYWALSAAQTREFELAQRLRGAIDATRDGLWYWDVVRDQIVATPGGDLELGWDAAKTIQNLEGWRTIVHPDDWKMISSQMDALNREETDDWHLEQRFKTADGGWHWIEIKGHVVSRASDGSVVIMEGSYHSINGLKQTQLTVERTNRALGILVTVYDAVSSGRSSEQALSMLVEGIARSQDCPVAWVGEALDNEDKRIQPFAWAGPASEFARTGNFKWDDSPYGCGPSGTCIKTQKPCLVDDVADSDMAAAWRDKLGEYGIRSGVSVPIILPDGQKFVLHVAGRAPQQFSDDDSDTYEMIANVLKLIIGSADLAFQFGQSETARLEIADRLQKTVSGVIAALATVVEKRDPYTAGHQHRVAVLAVAIGREMKLSDDRLEGLRIGAWIHDIGKIGVPAEILSKPGLLDTTEIALIQRHAQIGYEIVKTIDFGWPVEKIIHQHHERIDGSGYPQGLKGDDITLEARIVAVADVVESMGTDRPYRKKIPWQNVVDEVADGRGSKYDEKVVDAAMLVLDRDADAFGFVTN